MSALTVQVQKTVRPAICPGLPQLISLFILFLLNFISYSDALAVQIALAQGLTLYNGDRCKATHPPRPLNKNLRKVGPFPAPQSNNGTPVNFQPA